MNANTLKMAHHVKRFFSLIYSFQKYINPYGGLWRISYGTTLERV